MVDIYCYIIKDILNNKIEILFTNNDKIYDKEYTRYDLTSNGNSILYSFWLNCIWTNNQFKFDILPILNFFAESCDVFNPYIITEIDKLEDFIREQISERK